MGFLHTHWEYTWRPYTFLRSTWDAKHHPQNSGVGHGWVEGGPLLPVKTELYQSGLGVEALRCLADMARIADQSVSSKELDDEAEHQRKGLDQDFWSEQTDTYAFALDQQNNRVEIPSVLTTVPMWFGLLDPAHAQLNINSLAGPDHTTDWGMRILSAEDARYNPSGYHFGSVWPLFTGWASVAEYRYHRPIEGYASLRANSLLALDGSLGHVTEVLSGTYYEGLGTASPHQIWSSAMVISPLVRGMLGLSVDENKKTVRLAPHLPAGWKHFALHHLSACGGRYDVSFQR